MNQAQSHLSGARLAPGGRALVYDATHLVHRLLRASETGIDRVDQTMAESLLDAGLVHCAVHAGVFRPHVFSARRFARIVEWRRERDAGRARSLEGDDAAVELRRWICGGAAGSTTTAPGRAPAPRLRWRQLRARIWGDGGSVPQNAIYLNIAQAALEHPRFFRWLDARPDVTPVFFLHDLLPFDHPDLFRPDYDQLFERRFQTILRFARAIVTTSVTTRDRIVTEYRSRGRDAPPVFAHAPPSQLGGPATSEDIDDALSAQPYFVMIGTIEPRKNHATILSVWPEIARATGARLVLVGGDGWMCDDVLEKLSGPLSASVRRARNLSAAGLRRIVVNARAVLAPSLAEGFGLPVAEALGLGTPVIASDIPVFREISRNAAVFVPPRDQDAWRAAILAAATELRGRAQDAANPFSASTSQDYAAAIRDFLSALPSVER